MNITFLDSAVLNPGDISWKPIERLGNFTNYKRTSRETFAERMAETEAVFVDSFSLDAELLEQAPKLTFIGIAATGFNHVDLEKAKELGIAVANVPAYSTEAVAQQAISLLLSVTNKVELYNHAVVSGEWQKCKDYTFIKAPVTLLSGRSIGIVGYGNIGKKVGQIAEAFGMTVNVYSQNPEAAVKSDIVSLHCPLTKENEKMVDKGFIENMKDGAILINTARGGLVDEEALAEALKSGKLAGAGLDVMAKEPPEEGNPLIGLENCWITPHIGFIPVETRKVVIDTCGANLESFMKGELQNRLV